MSRLIDADALMKIYRDRVDKVIDRYGVYSSEHGILVGAMKLLEEQPTIEERKKGKWIPKSTNGEMFDSCSVCGYVEWDAPRNFLPELRIRYERWTEWLNTSLKLKMCRQC